MLKVLETEPGVDLSGLTAWLWRQQIPHRVTHFDGRQQLWLAREQDAERVLEACRLWQQGRLPEDQAAPALRAGSIRWLLAMRRYPVTLTLIGISLLLALLTGLGNNLRWLHWFTFVDFNFQGNHLIFQSLSTLITEGQWWRWISPVFIHFGVLHLVFNCLWIWELGRRVERLQKPVVLVALVLVTGVLSNLAQYLMTGPLFGGLSGVIFALMGYTWLWDRLNPERKFGLSPGLMTFMLIWLLLGVSGAIEAVGLGGIANTAHLVGLLSGLAMTPLLYGLRRHLWRRDRIAPSSAKR